MRVLGCGIGKDAALDFRIVRAKAVQSPITLWSLQVVAAARSKYVHHERVLQSRCLVIDAATHHKAVTGARVKGLITYGDREPSAHHVNDLIVRVLVPGPDPAFFHAMLSQQKLVIECSDAPDQAGLRQRGSSGG